MVHFAFLFEFIATLVAEEDKFFLVKLASVVADLVSEQWVLQWIGRAIPSSFLREQEMQKLLAFSVLNLGVGHREFVFHDHSVPIALEKLLLRFMAQGTLV